jgi:PST family polysaccharide transporter
MLFDIWVGIFVSIGNVIRAQLVAEELQKYLIITTIVGALINVILNYYLIPGCGMNGAAIASVISFAYSGFFGFLLISGTRHIIQASMKAFFSTRRLTIV